MGQESSAAANEPMSNDFTPGVFEKWYYTGTIKGEWHMPRKKTTSMVVTKEILGAPITQSFLDQPGEPSAVPLVAEIAEHPIKEYTCYPILQDIDLPALVLERQEQTERIKAAAARIAEIDMQLKPALMASDTKSVYFGAWIVTHKTSLGRKSLDKALLLKNGVTAKQIADSYKQGKGSSSITVMDRAAAEAWYKSEDEGDEA